MWGYKLELYKVPLVWFWASESAFSCFIFLALKMKDKYLPSEAPLGLFEGQNS